MEEHVSTDGRLRLLVVTRDDGDVTLGFDGFPWHAHADILAAMSGLPECEAIRRFIDELVGGASVIVLLSVGGELQDIWVSDTPERDAGYAVGGESVELRHWDGRKWSDHTPRD